MRSLVLRILIIIFSILLIIFGVLYLVTLKSVQDLVLFVAALLLLIVIIVKYDLHRSVLLLFPKRKTSVKSKRMAKTKKASFSQLYNYDQYKSVRDDFEERFGEDDVGT